MATISSAKAQERNWVFACFNKNWQKSPFCSSDFVESLPTIDVKTSSIKTPNEKTSLLRWSFNDDADFDVLSSGEMPFS